MCAWQKSIQSIKWLKTLPEHYLIPLRNILAFSDDILPLKLKYLSHKLNLLRSFQKIKKLDVLKKYNKSLYAQP